MSSLFWSRGLTELTLTFHIIWATIGVGIPLFVTIAEGWGIWKKDPHYILMARRWTRGFVITVAVGVVTGTCIGLMLSLLWPRFMQLAGNVISLPLFLETFAFFFEAIFLGIYLYTWDRFKNPIVHWLTSIPVAIGAMMSAVFITTVNAFMNTPAGFTLDKLGRVTNIDPFATMFNPATPSKVEHVLSSAYVSCAFLLAAFAAYALLRGRTHVYYKKVLSLTMISGLILALLTFVAGDISGKFLAAYQPAKLAAAEWHFDTKTHADLMVGGVLDPKTLQVKDALEIPSGLSILAGGSTDSKVIGLKQIPRDQWPPLYIHYLFDGMVAIGMYLMAIPALFLLLRFIRKRSNRNPEASELHPWLLRGIWLGAPLAFLAIELGWYYDEVGRQPWIVTGYMRVDQAATTASNVGTMTFLFTLLYFALATIAIRVLVRLFKNNPPEAELAESEKA